MSAEQANQKWWSTPSIVPEPSVNELRRRTQEYWRREDSTGQRLKWYIETLLPQELNCADKRGALEFHPCDTLVLLVGYSVEPLLQTIGVFQPKRIMLLLNRWYGSQDDPQRQSGLSRGQDLKEWIGQWLAPRLCQMPDMGSYEVADQPETVFRALCEHVLPDQQRGDRVVVDITGAKKSMDAGAFLFAAYADIPISYVDFEDYDEKNRRPYGFTCRIGELANPYREFRLRDWERVRRLYERYHFRAAADTLESIVEVMREPMFRPEHRAASVTMLEVLRFYEAWDDGDHHRAQELLPGLQRRLPAFAPPLAIILLGNAWPHADGNADAAAQQLIAEHDRLCRVPHAFFESNRLLLTYARDELAKIERLVRTNEDNRSALLRAAGLDELLLKARLVRLWQTGQEGQIGLWDQDEHYLECCRSPASDVSLHRRLYDRLLRQDDADHMRLTLQGKNTQDRRLDRPVPAFIKLDGWQMSYRARPVPGAPRLGDYERDIALRGEMLTELRNRAIHTYLYVTQPIAEAAVALACANLAEFRKNWTRLGRNEAPVDVADRAERLSWDELCKLCGAIFLPLASQHKEEA